MQHRSPARSRRLAHRPRRPQALAPAAIDQPSAAEPASGRTVEVIGWTWPFASERIRRVELLVDDAPVGAGRLTLRPDISEALDRPEAILSGFEATIELTPETPEKEIVLSLEAHGLEDSVWRSPGWHLPIGPMERVVTVANVGEDEQPMSALPVTAELDGPDRTWTRRRLGYDPWHVVVLIPDAVLSAGPAIAALDVVAERWPNLELLVPGVRSDSYIANLMQRAVYRTGLEDRVTVPFVPAPAIGWQAVADLTLAAPSPGAAGYDLAASIEALDDACRSVAGSG